MDGNLWQDRTRLLKELVRAKEKFPESPEITLALAQGYERMVMNLRNAKVLLKIKHTLKAGNIGYGARCWLHTPPKGAIITTENKGSISKSFRGLIQAFNIS